jgi:hypothetical protein
MPINPVAGSASPPSQAPVAARQSAASQASPTATAPKAQTAAPAVKVVSAAVQEATESPGQTIKEAASGDHQAQKRIHHGSNPGSVINTKA